MKAFITPIIICSVLFFTNIGGANAQATDERNQELKKEFNQVYGAYKKALKENQFEKFAELTKESYRLGCLVYSDKHINCAKLAINYAAELKPYDWQIKQDIYNKALIIYNQHFAESSVEVTELSIMLAESLPYKQKKQAFKILGEALKSLKDNKDINDVVRMQLQMKAGQKYLRLGSKKSRILVESYQALSKIFQADDARLLESRFWAAKYHIANNRKHKAIELLEQNVEQYEKIKEYSHPYELVARAQLVNLYERVRKSEQATKHCIAIGALKPWNDSQEQTPLFRSNPVYPVSAARRGKEGWVQLQFTIDKQGMVKDPLILATSNKETFNKASLQALKEWRYAPKFENGVPVEATTTVQLDYKMGD
ncbi:energy transducer TonB [Thalassotalea sp. ND16A]|uniref:energy transducer TonB n=1 Tax=Thalassotalea sp. ND16A TaxID=1535422 RepID=UPI00051A29C2|nr:energy transducer TonB [Thalassotalea sp. ND16A]KGJ99161.1 hypothetical protein ND16A_3925 [Thalassotalea sp. ND16A]